MRKKYLIYAPNFTIRSGGQMWLHKFCNNLNELGEEAYLAPWGAETSINTNSSYNTPIFSREVTDEYIVVYPEVTEGNPLKANNVVRWLLYVPGLNPAAKVDLYGENDLVISSADYVSIGSKKKFKELRIDNQILTAYESFQEFFQNEGLIRSGSCHLFRKGKGKSTKNYVPKDSLEINAGQIIKEKGFEGLAEIFNEKEVFYSYDHLTYISVMAALCGCLSIVVPDGDTDAKEWYGSTAHMRYGIAYGPEEIPHAKETAHLVRQNLIEIEKESLEQTKIFIQRSQEYFSN